MNNREWFLPSERLEQFMAKLPDWEAVQAGAKCPEVIATREHIVCSLYKAGYSFRDIGELMGFSHQRSKQIVDNYEGPQRPKGRRHRTKPEESIQVAYDRLAALHASDDLLLG